MTNQTEAAQPVLTHDLFEPLMGEDFITEFVEGRFALKLIEAKLLPRHNPDVHSRPPFALLFKCPDQRVIAQGMYNFTSERLGVLEIFVVPVAQDAEGISYEAIFN